MQAKEKHTSAINRISKTPDAKHLAEFLSELISHYADIRNLPVLTNEELKARQLACEIIQTEILNRLRMNNLSTEEITEEYE